MTQEKQISETHILGLLLALTGGFLDAHTYICRGGVFANAQTGNIVLLGLRLTSKDWIGAFYYLMPISAFVLGILICEAIQTRYKWASAIHWRQIIVLVEIFFLIAAGFIPLGRLDTIVNIMVSFICATTMCTGNLRSATENLYLYKKTGKKEHLKNSLQYYNVILFFILGAAAGGLLSSRLGSRAIWISCLGLLTVFTAMIKRRAL